MPNKLSSVHFFFILFGLLAKLSAEEPWLYAPNLENTKAVNQRKAGHNACGPACLLDAYQSAGPRWQKSLRPYVRLKSDKEKIQLLIRRHGLKRSLKFSNQIRWHRNKGVNIADLGAMANEMRRGFSLQKIQHEVFFRKEKEDHQQLLKRVHRSFRKSLKAGFPPIISIRRTANRKLPRGGGRMWLTLQGHFVVITGFPQKLSPDADSFEVSYRDPWTGRDLRGTVRIPKESFWASPTIGQTDKIFENPTLVADFPYSRIGIKKVRKGERHALTLSSGVGAF